MLNKGTTGTIFITSLVWRGSINPKHLFKLCNMQVPRSCHFIYQDWNKQTSWIMDHVTVYTGTQAFKSNNSDKWLLKTTAIIDWFFYIDFFNVQLLSIDMILKCFSRFFIRTLLFIRQEIMDSQLYLCNVYKWPNSLKYERHTMH